MTQGNISPIQAAEHPIDPGVRIGHVHLRTAGIDRVRDFYVGVLGFDVVAEARDVPGWGTTGDILFVSAGGYHHHLGFNTWKSAGGGPQPDGVTGLHHVALNYPTRAGLADAVRRLQAAGVAGGGRRARAAEETRSSARVSPRSAASERTAPVTVMSPTVR
jgi:catechol 2,3-dioxygenase